MKVRIPTISPEGFEIDDSISKDDLNLRLNENPTTQPDITFIDDAVVKIKVSKILFGAEAKGKAIIKYEQNCSRCDIKVTRTEECPITAQIQPVTSGEEFIDLEDLGVVYYEDEYADLRPYIEETIILSLNLFWSPEINKFDKCTECKKPCFAVESEESHQTKKKLFEAFKKSGLN